MAEVAHTNWYRAGTVAVTTNSTKVYGSGTKFLTAGINPGATFRVDRTSYACEVLRVISDTELELAAPYYGNSGSGLTYSIDRNFQSTLPAQLASDIAALTGKYEKYIDDNLARIVGPSAYDVAVAEGYTGTKAQWLNSLKAAGELTTLLGRTEILTYHSAGAHNALYRGKNLGNTLTDAQSAAIRAGTFEDLYHGDYWAMTTQYTYYVATGDQTAQNGKTYFADVNGTALATQPTVGDDISEAGYYEAVTATATVNWRIADLDYYWRAGDTELTTHHAVIVPDTSLYSVRMNPTNITEGAHVGSEMYTKNLARAKALITAAFGANHILTHRAYLQNAVKDGKPSGGAWLNSTVELMTESIVYGGRHFSSGSQDGGDTIYNRYNIDKTQLNLFRHRPDLISNRQWYWLRDVVSGACFASVNGADNANYNNASNSRVVCARLSLSINQ